MKTIKGFENALGRKVLWASSLSSQRDAYIQRIRIYPHALAEPNAYYSPEKTALLFGYFRDSSDLGKGLPAAQFCERSFLGVELDGEHSRMASNGIERLR